MWQCQLNNTSSWQTDLVLVHVIFDSVIMICERRMECSWLFNDAASFGTTTTLMMTIMMDYYDQM